MGVSTQSIMQIHPTSFPLYTMLSSFSIGHLIWASSCLLLILCILIYDGLIKRDIRIISSIFLSYLFLQIIISTVYIVYDSFIVSDNTASIISFIASDSV